jgi:hypothetical protein
MEFCWITYSFGGIIDAFGAQLSITHKTSMIFVVLLTYGLANIKYLICLISYCLQ